MLLSSIAVNSSSYFRTIKPLGMLLTLLLLVHSKAILFAKDNPDESVKYVRQNLKEYLAPATVTFQEGGKVKITLKFKKDGKGNDKATHLFTPTVASPSKRSRFRWSLPQEEIRTTPGIRVSDRGMAHLKCWFRDDLKAEIDFFQPVSQGQKPVLSVVFTNNSGEFIGSNYGKQCAFFKKGKLRGARGVKGAVELMKGCCAIKRTNSIQIKSGKFEVSLQSKRQQTYKYPEKKFQSGRVGLIWGGGVAASIGRIEITGSIDIKKMATEMKKAKKKKQKK